MQKPYKKAIVTTAIAAPISSIITMDISFLAAVNQGECFYGK
jgi:hypothetical protein